MKDRISVQTIENEKYYGRSLQIFYINKVVSLEEINSQKDTNYPKWQETDNEIVKNRKYKDQ